MLYTSKDLDFWTKQCLIILSSTAQIKLGLLCKGENYHNLELLNMPGQTSNLFIWNQSNQNGNTINN